MLHTNIYLDFILRHWVLSILAFLTTFFAMLHPELLMMANSPMAGDKWAIKDLRVSWTAFMPALRDFRYELFDNGNILWSNLRGLGQPLLGNAVQGAPLFPLTLALIWMPDQLFWSAMPIIRLLLIALGCFAVARKVFGLSLTASLCFALLAGFNLNTFRWINHPWSNGMLAGIWYLYFIHRVCFSSERSVWLKNGNCIGLIVSVFAMVTCGFPETAAAIAILVVVLFCVQLFIYREKVVREWKYILRDLLICHFSGFGLAAMQLFALIEYISYTEAIEQRSGFISNTYKVDEFTQYWLSQFSLTYKSSAQLKYLNFTIGMFGFFLACKGLVAIFFNSKNRSRSLMAYSVGFMLLMLLFVLKAFGLSEVIERIFAVTPVLAESHFALYFSPLFYLGVAFFAAVGVLSYQDSLNWQAWQRGVDIALSVILIVLVYELIQLSGFYFARINSDASWSEFLRSPYATPMWVFIAIAGLITLLQLLLQVPSVLKFFKAHSNIYVIIISTLILVGVLAQSFQEKMGEYVDNDNTLLFMGDELKGKLQKVIKDLPIPVHELRSSDQSGEFLELGVASMDNGVSAMLPPDTRLVRSTLYDTLHQGYLPLKTNHFPWSGDVMSNNLKVVRVTPDSNPNWSIYEREPDIGIKIRGQQKQQQTVTIDPWMLEGGISTNFEPARLELWFNLVGEGQSIWIKTNNRGGSHIGVKQGRSRFKMKWRILIPLHWLQGQDYKFKIRAVNHQALAYDDTDFESIYLSRSEFLQPSILMGESENRVWQILYLPDAMPRAYIASECGLIAENTDPSSIFENGQALVDGKIWLRQKSVNSKSVDTRFCDNYSTNFAKVSILYDHGKELQLDHVAGPALVHLNDTYYPGWSAYDEGGEPLEIFKSNVGMRAVYLPENRSYKVIFKYQPGWLLWAYVLMFLSVLSLLYLCLNSKSSRGYVKHNS